MDQGRRYPHIVQTVLDTTDVRGLAEFYRALLGLVYRPGDEIQKPDDDWLVLRDGEGRHYLAFQQVDAVAPTTWPEAVPQQLHLDMTVATYDELIEQHGRAIALGARMLLDRANDEHEPLRVYADPAGHPFCIFAAKGGGVTR